MGKATARQATVNLTATPTEAHAEGMRRHVIIGLIFLLIGLAVTVVRLASDGPTFGFGLLLGVLFVAAGLLRLYESSR